MTELWLADDVRPMGQMLLHSAAKDPGKEALVFPDTRLTYRDLADARRQSRVRWSRWASRPASTSAC